MANNVGIDLSAVRDLNLVGLLTSLEGLNARLCITSTACERSKFQSVPFTVSPDDEDGIYLITLTSEEMEEVYEMSLTYREITFTECTVLYMAAKYCQAIVTADPCMIKVAGKLNIAVYGYEWALEQLVVSGIITTTTASMKFQEIKTTVNPAFFRDRKAAINFRLQKAEEAIA